MNTPLRARALAIPLALCIAVAAMSTMTACTPPTLRWSAGNTHGAIIEPTAGRASLGIYRKPRKVLHDVYKAGGIRRVQDAIWAVGQPPAISKTFAYRGHSITTSFGTVALRGWTHDVIYADPADLRGALLEAQASGDCLALTLISYGKVTRNWTHKQVGCQMGALP